MSKLASLPLKTILVVFDRDEARIALKWFLTYSGYVVDSARNAEEAIAVFDPVIHDIVVTDNRMPGMTGSEMAQVIKDRSPSTPVVMYAGSLPEDRSCLDLVLEVSTRLLVLKTGLDKILMAG